MKFNMLQTIAVTGVCVSAVSQAGLHLIDKSVTNFWALYPTWVGVFIIGTIFKLFGKPHEHSHEHDHHEHHVH